MEFRDYGQDRELIKQFFKEFSFVNADGEVKPKYEEALTDIANREKIHLLIDVTDVEQFNNDLATQIYTNVERYTQLFYLALDEILPSYKTKDVIRRDIMDIFIEQRLFVAERNRRDQQMRGGAPDAAASNSQMVGNSDIEGKYPADLLRRVEITFKPSNAQPLPIRSVLSEHIGHLITIRGLVTRVADVKPQITIAAYTCDQCGCETFQTVSDLLVYTPLFTCTSAICKANKAPGRLTHQIRGSKFVKMQEIKIQELADEVPTGNIPRAVRIFAFGEMTRQCTPGDVVSISGVFLPLERTHRSGEIETYVKSHYISLMSKSEEGELVVEPMSEAEARELMQSDDFFTRLSSSIAPEIFAHEHLKKALLLLLVGGVDKNSQGMKIRGNINICLMGDPGVAKSQLLSFIDRVAPRSQYTTGRGSSGVGLTAAVLKDPVTNELVLEGGALVLADRGVCCLDEFDKMMDADRTAIHEVMEQQTVSIAKAGIMTTLNARVSILAAANPAFGRYNIHKTVTDNLELPPALLSRFDLLWLIRDEPMKQKDLDLAQHVTYIHTNPNDDPRFITDAFDLKLMRRFIALCKTKNPVLDKEMMPDFLNTYLNIRKRKRLSHDTETLFTSPRSLLAIIRLSTANARLRLADKVEPVDLAEAVRLYNFSRASLERFETLEDSESQMIMRMIDELAGELPLRRILKETVVEKASERGFSSDTVHKALRQLVDQSSISIVTDYDRATDRDDAEFVLIV